MSTVRPSKAPASVTVPAAAAAAGGSAGAP